MLQEPLGDDRSLAQRWADVVTVFCGSWHFVILRAANEAELAAMWREAAAAEAMKVGGNNGVSPTGK